MTAKKIAVVLCGSGFKDGSEIRESVATLWALSRHKAEVQCFAPNANQHDVVNCLTSKPVAGETRNMLVEAARIARGKVKPLTELDPSKFDGIILPGGFGAAKNLCTFAFEGSRGVVIPDLKKRLEEFHSLKKPIGAICIAPAIVALSFPQKKFSLTLGAPSEASQEIEKLGHRHVVCEANEFHFDEQNKIATTPAYMHDSAELHEVFEGIERLTEAVVKRA